MSEYIAKASIEPRDYRVVFLIQKKRDAATSPFFVLYNNQNSSFIPGLLRSLPSKPAHIFRGSCSGYGFLYQS